MTNITDSKLKNNSKVIYKTLPAIYYSFSIEKLVKLFKFLNCVT